MEIFDVGFGVCIVELNWWGCEEGIVAIIMGVIAVMKLLSL